MKAFPWKCSEKELPCTSSEVFDPRFKHLVLQRSEYRVFFQYMFTRCAILFVIVASTFLSSRSQQPFVTVNGRQLEVSGKAYYFIGTNYWYGGLLGLEKDRKRGVERLRKELDFLKANGVTNLRLMAGAEGSGALNGVLRVGPSLQPEQGRFNEKVLDGLDLVLYEMSKRKMRAVIFFSNNWEWSGGFQQYLIWNGVISNEWIARKPTWDELRDNVAKFYSCTPCKEAYSKQAALLLSRTNKITKVKYAADPTIMAWELANEPRPMRPFANDDYRRWITETAAAIKLHDKNHLVTIGHEGWIGTQDIELFEQIHADKNIDYMTIHIWPKNWGWFAAGKMKEDFSKVEAETAAYIAQHAVVAAKLNKPLVIEEFGLPRDGTSFEAGSATTLRDKYFAMVLRHVGRPRWPTVIAGANFWAFGGTARPVKSQVFWKTGDEYTGDPPMEEQGLNSVFDADRSTWDVISKAAQHLL